MGELTGYYEARQLDLVLPGDIADILGLINGQFDPKLTLEGLSGNIAGVDENPDARSVGIRQQLGLGYEAVASFNPIATPNSIVGVVDNLVSSPGDVLHSRLLTSRLLTSGKAVLGSLGVRELFMHSDKPKTEEEDNILRENGYSHRPGLVVMTNMEPSATGNFIDTTGRFPVPMDRIDEARLVVIRGLLDSAGVELDLDSVNRSWRFNAQEISGDKFTLGLFDSDKFVAASLAMVAHSLDGSRGWVGGLVGDPEQMAQQLDMLNGWFYTRGVGSANALIQDGSDLREVYEQAGYSASSGRVYATSMLKAA